MIPTIVFDIDGTLSDCEHRRHLVTTHPKNWPEFFARLSDDPPKKDIVWLNKVLARTNAASIVYCTGRGEEYREPTEAWLRRHVTNERPMDLRMRPAGDSRPDDIIKREMVKALRSENRYILLWVDDRERVVQAVRRAGITVLQCAPGDFNPLAQEDVTDKLVLTLMVGPSGAGKSTYVENTFDPDCVLSSDTIRGRMTGNFKDQSKNAEVFSYIHDTIVTRINYGLHTVVDATNIRKRDRMDLVSLVPAHAKVRYIVVDRPLEEKLRDGGWRLGVEFAQKDGTTINLIEKHHQTMKSQLKDILKGDGLLNMEVTDARVAA